MLMLERLLLLILPYLFGKKVFQIAVLFSAQRILYPCTRHHSNIWDGWKRCFSLLKQEKVIVKEEVRHDAKHIVQIWGTDALKTIHTLLSVWMLFKSSQSRPLIWAVKNLLCIILAHLVGYLYAALGNKESSLLFRQICLLTTQLTLKDANHSFNLTLGQGTKPLLNWPHRIAVLWALWVWEECHFKFNANE